MPAADATTDDLAYALFDTAIGACAIAWSQAGIRCLQLPEANRNKTRARLLEQLGVVQERPPTKVVGRAMVQIVRHLAGRPAQLDRAQLDMSAVPPFARKVYRALRGTEPGQTLSYGELAARAGSPKAARAVGRAMATNPVPLIVPCHRVLAAGGKPGGFSAYGGTTTKAALLAIEGVELEREPFLGGAQALPYDGAAAVRALRRADPELAQLIDAVGSFRLQLKRPKTTFAALAEAVVYQQLTGKAAATIFSRVVALFPGRRVLHPGDVDGATEALLRSAGLSRAKAAALQDLAAKTLSGQLPSIAKLRRMHDDAIVETLTAVRGIGPWTAQMLLMFQLGRPDVLATGDYGLRKGFARAFSLDELPSPAQLDAHGERWRPYRSVASWYLWRALEL